MRRFAVISALFGLFFPAVASAAEGNMEKARGLLLGGEYEEAAEVYAALGQKEPAAAVGLARCLRAQGKVKEAVEKLSTIAEGHADVQAELARLAFERGDNKQAKARADAALGLERDQLLAVWIVAEVDRTAGRLDEAQRGYSRLIRHYNMHDVDRAESLRWIGLGAARYARWNRLSGQFHFLANDLYPEALKLDPRYWAARYEAGMLFLEKYNRPDASSELRAALELNRNAAEVHVALARLALDQRDVQQAEASIDRALEINPRLLSAWLGKTDLAWSNFKPRESLRLLREKALPINPVDEEALGRVAACYLLLDESPKQGPSKKDRATRFTRLVDEVTGRNPHAGDFFVALAERLRDRNKYAMSERFFRRALEVMPQKVGPRSNLGLLYMRMGLEDEARKILDEAFDVDPFNVRVKNTLELLDVLGEMETLDTEHFMIRFDGKHDTIVARCFSKQLEETYPRWCELFGYRPPYKPLLEVFNRAKGISGQHWFSTRMIGLPHLGPVAASTGRIVAMASPNEPGVPRSYHWARVLKHELVHVITLQQTRFNIPHWYTEGLAVYFEDCPRPEHWNRLLVERVPKGELFDLQDLNFGFSRPNSGGDRQMAYCQAELYVEYMLGRFGPAAQRQLLAAYRQGLTTSEAIRHVFGVTEQEFERGYVDYLKETIAGLSRLRHPSGAALDELRKAHKDRPEDSDAAAELAYAYIRRGAEKEALELAESILKKHPKHQLATYVVARLWLKADKAEEAIELLEDCLDRRSPQPNVLNLLAGLRLKAEQFDEAAELYALGERLDSVNLAWIKALARVYLTSKNGPKLTEVLARLAKADADDLASRKKLAQMAMGRQDFAAAADWANQAVQINVMAEGMHCVLAESLAARGQHDRAIEEFETAVELKPDEPRRRFALAVACVRAKQPDKALQTLDALLELQSDYPGAEELRRGLTEEDGLGQRQNEKEEPKETDLP